jgi:hypothetical protein
MEIVIFVTATMDLHNNPDVYYTDIFLQLMSKIYQLIQNQSIELDSNQISNLENLLKQLAGESEITVNKNTFK